MKLQVYCLKRILTGGAVLKQKTFRMRFPIKRGTNDTVVFMRDTEQFVSSEMSKSFYYNYVSKRVMMKKILLSEFCHEYQLHGLR